VLFWLSYRIIVWFPICHTLLMEVYIKRVSVWSLCHLLYLHQINLLPCLFWCFICTFPWSRWIIEKIYCIITETGSRDILPVKLIKTWCSKQNQGSCTQIAFLACYQQTELLSPPKSYIPMAKGKRELTLEY